MAQIYLILIKICHFSGIGDTKVSKYPLIVDRSSCKTTFKGRRYMFSTKMKLEGEPTTIKENIDNLPPIY